MKHVNFFKLKKFILYLFKTLSINLIQYVMIFKLSTKEIHIIFYYECSNQKLSILDFTVYLGFQNLKSIDQTYFLI